MEDHGTPSIEPLEPGWYRQFWLDVLSQLPKPEEVSQDVADNWHQNRGALRKGLQGLLLPPKGDEIVGLEVVVALFEITNPRGGGIEQLIVFFNREKAKKWREEFLAKAEKVNFEAKCTLFGFLSGAEPYTPDDIVGLAHNTARGLHADGRGQYRLIAG